MEYTGFSYRYVRRYNLGNYEHREEAAEISGRIDRNDDAEEVLLSARALTSSMVEPAKLATNPIVPFAIVGDGITDDSAAIAAKLAEAQKEEDPFEVPYPAVVATEEEVHKAVSDLPKKRGRPRKTKEVEETADPFASALGGTSTATDAGGSVGDSDPFVAAEPSVVQASSPAIAAGPTASDVDPFAEAAAETVNGVTTPTPVTSTAAAEISDKQLMKAASEYVQANGPAAFRALIAPLGVKSAMDIPKDKRADLYAELTQ